MLALFVAFSVMSFGVTKTWIGGTGNWSSNGNWSPSGSPGSNDAIIISSGSPNNPGNLTIANSGSITLSNGATLNTSSNITINGNGQLIINGGTLIHTGNKFEFPYSSIANVIIYSGTFSTEVTNFKINSRMEMSGGRFLAKDGLAIQSGKSFIATAGYIQVDGTLDIQSSGSSFSAGSDSLVINGKLTVSGGCSFYGNSAAIVINGMGNGNVKNEINGTFYTNSANVTFNTSATTEIGSGGKFRGNTGTILFNDVATIGNNGQLFVDSASIKFTKDLTVSQSGSINAGSGSLIFEGNAEFRNSGTLDAGSANITFEGSASFTQSGTLNGGTSTLNFEGSATFSNSGTLNAGGSAVNFGGNVTISNNGGTINADSSTMSISGNLNNAGNFNAGTSTVILNGSGSQTISDDISFYNLTIQTQGTVTANGNITVQNGGVIGPNSTITIPDNNDQFTVIGDLTDSTSGSAVNTNKPYVTGITINSSTEIVVHFNETVTVASAQNASNSTWAGHTISNRTRIDTNKLRIQFTPAISQNVEYTLNFQSIQNAKNPVGTMSTGITKKFTWTAPSAPGSASTLLSYASITSNSYTLNWTKGNGTKRIVIARASSAVNFSPINGNEYTANASFGAGTNLGSGNYVVYQGTGQTFSLSGLSAGITYHFAIYEYNGSGATTIYQTVAALTSSQVAAYTAPTTQTSNFNVSGSSDTSITLSWSAGDGSSRIVIARASSTINSLPSNLSSYTGNTAFGSGSEIGSNNYVVYSGSGTSVTVTGLLSNKKYYFTVLEYNGSGGLEQYLLSSNPIIATNTYIRVNVKVFLEGPFNGTDMDPIDTSILPKSQVYTNAPFSYAGAETVTTFPNTTIVDWVLVELRESSNIIHASDTSVVGRRAGFLLTDGRIVDLDGSSPLYIQTNRSGNMYAVVYHRTHIPVQSNDTLSRGPNKFNFDFTVSGSTAYGNNDPLTEVTTGVYAMYCGRVATNTSNSIGASDASAAWNARNEAGYQEGDVNLDGLVDAGDRSSIYNNQGTSSEIVQ